MCGTQEHVDQEVEKFGVFNMETVAKKAKRIGLLFSTSHVILDIDPSRCRDIADIERESHIFTDGMRQDFLGTGQPYCAEKTHILQEQEILSFSILETVLRIQRCGRSRAETEATNRLSCASQ